MKRAVAHIVFGIVLAALSGVILLALGYAGEQVAYIWGSEWLHDVGGLKYIPPLSRWFGESYAYNNGELIRTAFAAWLVLLSLLTWSVLFRLHDFQATFLRLYLLFWTATAAFGAFLIFCASLPFLYLIRALSEPRTNMWYINRAIEIGAPAGIVLLVLIKAIACWRRKPNSH